MGRQIEKTALHRSQLTVYVNNEAEAEDYIGEIVFPMNTGESRRILTDNRVFCLYKMNSGKIELYSYSFKRRGSED